MEGNENIVEAVSIFEPGVTEQLKALNAPANLKKKSFIMPPSDPAEDNLCDSCQ